MHELSLMESLRQLALEEAERHGGGQILAMRLRLGSLAGVDPEALRFAFSVLMAEPPTEAARLEIEAVAARAFCRPCQQAFACPDGLSDCPRCGQLSAELLAGRELELVGLELAT